MHRSGTSAIAGSLQAAGLYSGANTDMIPALPENPAGFIELRDVTALNDRLLASLGWTWDAPDAAPLPDPPALSDLIAAGRALVQARLSASAPWLIKDPRVSLLLPWWRRILLDRFVAVVAVRDPAEVAWSLSVRNGFPLELGLALWAAYNRHLVAGMEGLPVVIVDYVELTRSPERHIADLLSALERTGLVARLDRQAAISSVQPTLRRSTQPGPAQSEGPLNDQFLAMREQLVPAAVTVHDRFSMAVAPASGWEIALLGIYRRLRRAEEDAVRAGAPATPPDGLGPELDALRQIVAQLAVEVAALRQSFETR